VVPLLSLSLCASRNEKLNHDSCRDAIYRVSVLYIQTK
jgi:hypothetical protein